MDLKLSNLVKEQFVSFLDNHDPQQFSLFLRNMLLEYIRLRIKTGFNPNFPIFLGSLEDLFNLLDRASSEIQKYGKPQNLSRDNHNPRKRISKSSKSKTLAKRANWQVTNLGLSGIFRYLPIYTRKFWLPASKYPEDYPGKFRNNLVLSKLTYGKVYNTFVRNPRIMELNSANTYWMNYSMEIGKKPKNSWAAGPKMTHRYHLSLVCLAIAQNKKREF